MLYTPRVYRIRELTSRGKLRLVPRLVNFKALIYMEFILSIFNIYKC
jgi:hypothetical protein